MSDLRTKISTALIAPVLFGASCLSCLSLPVQAQVKSSNTVMAQECADYQKDNSNAKTQAEMPSDVNRPLSIQHGRETSHHDAECHHSSNSAASEYKNHNFSKTASPAGHIPAHLPPIRTEFSFDRERPHILYKNEYKLTGTTIKKE